MSIYGGTYLLENGYIAFDEASYKNQFDITILSDDPYFAKYKKEIANANDLLKNNNINNVGDAEKRLSIAYELIEFICGVVASFNTGSLIGKGVANTFHHGFYKPASFILNLALGLVSSVAIWIAKNGNEDVYIKRGEKIINELDKLAKSSDDEKFKNKVLTQKEKLEDELKEMKKGVERTRKLFKK